MRERLEDLHAGATPVAQRDRHDVGAGQFWFHGRNPADQGRGGWVFEWGPGSVGIPREPHLYVRDALSYVWNDRLHEPVCCVGVRAVAQRTLKQNDWRSTNLDSSRRTFWRVETVRDDHCVAGAESFDVEL